MGHFQQVVSDNEKLLRELAASKGHAGLLEFAQANGFTGKKSFSLFKKYLLRLLAINYDTLVASAPLHSPEYIQHSQLRVRGWSENMIRQHLGNPDLIQPHPFHAAAPRLRLYARSRVDSLETTLDLGARKDEAAQRLAGKLRQKQEKIDDLCTKCAAMPVHVRKLEPDLLHILALKNFELQARKRSKNTGAEADEPSDDKSFMDRVKVNYIRHFQTDYDQQLAEIIGKYGANEALKALRTRIYTAIGQAYPDLAEEAARQLAVRLAKQG